MRDGSSLPPDPVPFEDGVALARRILAGKELHTGAQIQVLTLAKLAIALWEDRQAQKPKPIPLSRERGNDPYPEDRA